MNTQQLESFIQVAENLNFAHAAALLNVTQSAVSRQIHALEEELDTKLFYRTTRTVTLTPEGIIFLEHAKQILGQLQIATARIQHRSNLTARILRIGCESQADLLFLSEILETCRPCIHAFHPFLKVIPHRALMTLFYQGELDVLFGFREHLPIKNEILFTELRQVPLCCVLPQNHPYGEKESIRVEDLFTESLVACNSYTIPAQAVELQNLVAQHITPENIYVSENPQVALALVRAGYGCCILPQSPDIRDGLLYRPMQGTQLLPYGMSYNRSSSNGLLKEFLAVARQAAQI